MSHPLPGPDPGRVCDHQLAGLLARQAGRLLVDVRNQAWSQGRTRNQVMEMGDRAAHDHLVNGLARMRPDDAVLSEEGDDDVRRLSAERVWILDPLDGSRDYGVPGSVEWAVHVALVVNGVPVAAAVDLPAVGRLYGTLQEPVGGGRNRQRDRPIVITSRSQWGEAEHVAAAIGGVVRSCGSAGVKAMAVVEGTADVYVHPSGLYEWDVCAPAAVAASAGLDVCGMDGSDLAYNKARPVVQGLLVTRPDYTSGVRSSLSW
ncbi:MAG: 3'(2'),5'-bisphosphate nucleotidase CysQ [Acidimicrobiaceae bacterium]|nr:3'(2'),5'-bisphosphate nucleotidase CysQ [Acidimicrobiaceae bacterium]MDP6481709.1 3'(2'),5'-bisphosphate nucleotidase CysQ [Acidimicrobiales bacterium]MDP6697747.1 3'(2'),5'-bisphosphate nucleotidase CysQ [Acidimicrobiales bacterium]